MNIKDTLYQLCITCIGVLQVCADNSLLSIAGELLLQPRPFSHDPPIFTPPTKRPPIPWNTITNAPNMVMPSYKKYFFPTFKKHNITANIQRPPPLFLWPPAKGGGQFNNQYMPPMAPNTNLGYIKIPQIPMRFIGFPKAPFANKSGGILPPLPPGGGFIKHMPGYLPTPNPLFPSTPAGSGFAKIPPQYLGYFKMPQPNLPVHVPPPQLPGAPPLGGMNVTHAIASGVVIQGPAVPPKIGALDKVDSRHHLPMNHLFVPIPVSSPGDALDVKQKQDMPNVADILIIIDASKNMGHIDPKGIVVWTPGVVDFLNNLMITTPMGPNANKIGVVVVSVGIDDMIPLTDDKAFLLDALNNLRPTFRGGCTQKGIGTASSLFYQYGRPNAVKRIVLLTEGSTKCPYRNMAEIIYARKCGIDIIHVGFGKLIEPPKDIGTELQSNWVVAEPRLLPPLAKVIARRAFIPPIHGSWSLWSEWNPCSSSGTCAIGYQMRFRLCDNPKPLFGGRICEDYPAETRMCHMKPCINYQLGQWTRWSDFTPCSSPCGIGSMTRSRTCITLNGNPSATCVGKYVEMKECIVKACPVNGGWSFWSEWGLCSRNCGSGVKMRARQCDSPSSKNGGKPCPGNAVEEMVCKTGRFCPIHGGFGPWTDTGKCEGPCGMGVLTRTRKCDNPLPQFGGNLCKGHDVMTEPCDTMIPCPVPGGWGQWSDYSMCKANCGKGVRERKRQCDFPVPQHGGTICVGVSTEEVECVSNIVCPIPGQWSVWSDFTPCSARCGEGVRKRQRLCNNPPPQYGGPDCKDFPVEEERCDTMIPCPIDGGWGVWSEYSECPVYCGKGIVNRTRQCDSPVPKFGGANCIGLSVEDKMCDTGKHCPIHGYWSSWSPWGHCSASCAKGYRQRRRLCNNPSPAFGGLQCKGEILQNGTCDTMTPCPISGGWSDWSETPCSVKCGTGIKERFRECNNPVPMHGGPGCDGEDLLVVKCETGIPCPVPGNWSPWSVWGPCDASCGDGYKKRLRYCDNPKPMYGGMQCKGLDAETSTCTSEKPCPIPGQWSMWSEWPLCDLKCGAVKIERKRFCDSPPPQYGGSPCDGFDTEHKICDSMIMCPIPGSWSGWSGLSPCSVTCGRGTMERKRVCDNPPPQYGGPECAGLSYDIKKCDTLNECPIPGNWGPWTDYSACTVSCGKGTMKKTRDCNNPAPMFGGMPCEGKNFDVSSCDTNIFCPIPGGWSSWSDFSLCSVPCGVGKIRRYRECTAPAPMYGGRDCIAEHGIEVKICETGIPCPVDGQWSMWTDFGTCSTTCGAGIRQRQRQCNSPPPAFGGGMCPGKPLEEEQCVNVVECPIPGGWSSWSGYEPCNAICGVGIERRVRECIEPIPMYGGSDCFGQRIDDRLCTTDIPCPITGSWSPWSNWGACSVTCGTGMSQRVRECSNPPPLYGGKPCNGSKSNEMVCDTGINCPVPGGWSGWGDFSPCSVTCEVGVMQRHRVCDFPLPQYGGEICPGEPTQGEVCDTRKACPQDGGFSLWSKWSICSAKCGKGMQFRSRLCDNPPPVNGGADCRGQFREKRECLADVHCAIHGQWGSWNNFSPCSVTCGVGLKERSRLCDNPVPMYGGFDCKGKDLDVMPCDNANKCPVPGRWADWSPWTDCSVSCDVGLKQRMRSCTNPAPLYGGQPCEGKESRQEQVCNTGQPCPIDGGWSFWSDWLKCDAECGSGRHKRHRICNNPPAQFGGVPCTGDKEEEMICDSGVPCAVPGNWSPWSYWSACSASCAMGIQHRNRGCNDPAPMYGGTDCIGEDRQKRPCNSDILCPINGGWSPWVKWGHCSVTCGAGTRVRIRTCTNPHPSNGGLFCGGPAFEKGHCDTKVPCPQDGHWSLWGVYGPCNAKCGDGMQTRIRECNNPPSMYGGKLCLGGNSEDRPCKSVIPCPVPGGWTNWSPFGPCNRECGKGVQKRTRACRNPAPQFGGAECNGLDVDVSECDSGTLCPIHGAWSPWYKWSQCSETCGYGKEERRRECNNPPPAYGGMQCPGDIVDTRDCDTGMHCPVPGGWSSWSPFSMCSHTCGDGVKVKVRDCTNPFPQYGGSDCIGPNEESVPCTSGIECPIPGEWSSWGNFGPCNVNCGVGMHFRKRKCDSPVPMYGGQDCYGPATDDKICDTLKPCVQHGGWTFWSPWSGCTVSCEKGKQVRVRQCTNPNPLYGGLMCNGTNEDVRTCDTKIHCPIPGQWAPWSEWNCNAACGTGEKVRVRTCTDPVPQYGGLDCLGHGKEFDVCKKKTPCPIDGEWTLWTLWSGCSSSCGDVGVRERTRFCDNPPPQFGGKDCVGSKQNVEKCETNVVCPIHGVWSAWMEWSACSKTCAMGVQVRKRRCDAPAPQFGGFLCSGKSEELRDCDSGYECPIPGGWTDWTTWSKCNVNCGVGKRLRKRECTSPPPQFGGSPCKGKVEEEQHCDTFQKCAIHGNWSPWSGFSGCSVSCSFGVKTRERACNDPAPQFGGSQCKGDRVDSIGCESKIPCPVPGNWGPWYKWSKCSVTCESGKIERRRECNNPEPQFDGAPCQGDHVDISTCDTYTPCPIHGNWGVWSPLSKCSRTCGVGVKIRIRECTNPPPQYGGMECVGPEEEAFDCDTGTFCPVDGELELWSKWSKCSVTCGFGFQSRSRTCKPAMYGGIDCYGPLDQTRKCDTLRPCSLHGGWSFWSPWSSCSADCAMGIQTRVRECTNPIPKYGGMLCKGSFNDTLACDSGVPCPIHGQWGQWYEWSKCSKECGTGIRERRRECNSPAAQYGGLPCKGGHVEMEDCVANVPCPRDGGWTPWSPLSECSVTCGTGARYRFRECLNPEPAFGGLPCPGSNKINVECQTGIECAIPGNWSPWSLWGATKPCSVKCGTGVITRVRECNSPAPQFGGIDCLGLAVENKKCETLVPCPQHGGFTFWSPWSACMAKCGMGMETRVRECTNPVPKYGGLPCDGPHNETRDCYTDIPCAIPGNWALWSSWGICSVSCGEGMTKRFRTCSDPEPAYGGADCPGLPDEFMHCNPGVQCAVPGNWSPWSLWDMCDKPCGYGKQRRRRTCTDPLPMFGGADCVGRPKEVRKCDSGIPCAIPGNWSPWSVWEMCKGKCGLGKQTRTRDCTNPPPQYGGELCFGFDKEFQTCDTNIPCAIPGNWSPWSVWEMCKGKCGRGDQIRTRDCTNPPPQYGGEKCPGVDKESQSCFTGTPCPIPGNWAPWSKWDQCDADCGMGVQLRIRTCSNPRPQFGGDVCPGEPQEKRECNSRVICKVQGGWSPWGIWSMCSATCGAGMQIRKRVCDNPPAVGPGMECKGWAEDSRICNTDTLCPIHGGWSMWGVLGNCVADCSSGSTNGQGTQTRERLCDSPVPQNGGMPCDGPVVEKVPCFDAPPCNMPEWDMWTKWSKCSEPCGPGEMNRTRECVDKATGTPLPPSACAGNSIHVVPCEVNVCSLVQLNCTVECKWDNGIGYAPYVGDCSKFVQCDHLFGTPRIQTCAWGTVWSLDLLQCVYPKQSECDVCEGVPDGGNKPYFISCRSYWKCQNNMPIASCCPMGHRFNSFRDMCEPDPYGMCNEDCPPKDPVIDQTCYFKTSALGPKWYEEEIDGVWRPRPCGEGTIFSEEKCQCINHAGSVVVKQVCKPELDVKFNTVKDDLERNVGLHMQNVKYLGDGTAHFDGTAAINSNIFSNAEWGKDVYVYIRFKPEGKGYRQGLIHNSGCGKSDKGPSVFMGIDRDPNKPGSLNMKFATVPEKKNVEYEFVNITTADSKMVDAWFKFGNGQFKAEVDGITAVLDLNTAGVARRHGALNIGGNLCRIGNEAFGGFVGILDEVRIYKCKPPR